MYGHLDAVRTQRPAGCPHISLLILTFLKRSISVKTSLIKRVVKGIFVTRDRPFFLSVKCEMAIFFLVNRDFHSSREA